MAVRERRPQSDRGLERQRGAGRASVRFVPLCERRWLPRHVCWPLAAFAALGCTGSPPEPLPPETREVVRENETAALLSVNGTSAGDVWMVGADDGSGALVLHGDGSDWRREDV